MLERDQRAHAGRPRRGEVAPHAVELVSMAASRAQLARADADGQQTYLETSEERNLPFYERHGFRCPGRRDPAGLPPFWPMIRAPR